MFLETGLLSIMLAFATPQDFGYPPPYPSGTADNGNFSQYDPPMAQYPLLRFPSAIKISPEITIPTGTYAIKPSIDQKSLLLMHGHGEVYKLPITENTFCEPYTEKAAAQILIQKDKIIIIYQIENILKKSIIPISKGY
jgi:hypothetical protein